MKLKCKIDHISLPINSTYKLVTRDESIELPEEQAYAVLAKYSYAFEKDDGLTQKVIQRADRTKGPVDGVSNANETLLGERK